MIFITADLKLVDINKNMYSRDKAYYEVVHKAIFDKQISRDNFTKQLQELLAKVK